MNATPPIDENFDYKGIRYRFESLNEARLRRIRSTLSERQADFLHLLPLLFEVNHALLPGFASKQTPTGIPGYEPDRLTLNLAKRLAKSFQYRKPTQRRPNLLAIYLMGSPGTVAYSEVSDFDIWLCHNAELRPDQLALLQAKARGIETWAAQLGLEMHIFLVEPEAFRRGAQQDLSSESSGTAQHNLLLEEFYRTSVLIAGQAPLWWLVPPSQEANYTDYVQQLKQQRFPYIRNSIDFGGLTRIPAEEFFGAALWQLSKGIDSPYKSVLKLLLIEAYASEYPRIRLLSHQFKEAIYQGEQDIDALDPYLMMLHKVEHYLDGLEDNQRRELARRSFYIKAGLRLGDTVRQGDWRRELMEKTVSAWGWSRADTILMDARDSWKVQRVTEEKRILFEALSDSYRFLSDFARNNAGLARISQRDLTILGRKLYSAFERKAGKVELINRGISEDLHESHLSLHERIDEAGHASWLLYTGVVTPERVALEPPLKRSRSVVELVVWAYFNHILTRQTALGVYSRSSALSHSEFRVLLDRLYQLFPDTRLPMGDIGHFSQPARLVTVALFVNMGVPPLEAVTLPKERLAGAYSDALSHGSEHNNLVLSLDMVLQSSWSEIQAHRYSAGEGVVKCLCDYLKWVSPGTEARPPTINTVGFSAYRGSTVARRMNELFADVVDYFYGQDVAQGGSYLLAVGRGYYRLFFDAGVPRYQHYPHRQGLLQALARPHPTPLQLTFDRYALNNTALPFVYSHNEPGLIQLFFEHQPDGQTELLILDEHGALFRQRATFHDSQSLLNQYSAFFESVINRVRFQMQEGEPVGGPEGVAFYELTRQGQGRYTLQSRQPHPPQRKRFFTLQVVVEAGEKDKPGFTLYCDGREFSSLEYGNRLFAAVSRHVLELRKGGQRYPIYITDISLSGSLPGNGDAPQVQTISFLTYKRRIEEQLNASLGGPAPPRA